MALLCKMHRSSVVACMAYLAMAESTKTDNLAQTYRKDCAVVL